MVKYSSNSAYSSVHLAKVSRKTDLVPKLRDLHEALAELTQDPNERPKDLNTIAAQLVSDRILRHADREVRLLASCCVCDILRVYAPEAPYNEVELVKIFEVISAMLRLLSSYDVASSLGSLALYILSSLSAVNSCVVLIYLVRNNVPSAVDQLHALFESVILSANANHSDSVLSHMCSVLQSCIEEAAGQMDTQLLEMLLLPLLPAQKQENFASYTLCQSVIHRCAINLQQPLNSVVSQLLMDAAAVDEGNCSSVTENELLPDVYPLIYELHKIHPDLMLRIIPTLCLQLHTECDVTRLKAVKLLGRLFASPAANYGEEYRSNFDDYCGRFVDRSVDVRCEMLQCAELIMTRKPSLILMLEEPLAARLRDPDGDVRQTSLSVLLAVAMNRMSSLEPKTYFEMAERMKDKRSSVRSACRFGLSKIYSHYIYGSGASSVEADVARERLGVVPGYVLCSFGYPDISEKHSVVQMLQEYLLPRPMSPATNGEVVDDGDALQAPAAAINSTQTSDSLKFSSVEHWELRRSQEFERIVSDLSQTEKQCLQAILLFKTKIRDEVLSLLNVWPAGGAKVSGERSSAVDAAITRLTSVLPTPDKRSLDWNKLIRSRDKALHRLLTAASVPSAVAATCSCIAEYHLANRTSLKSKVESKSPIGVYIGMVYDVACSDLLLSGIAVQNLAVKHVKVLLAKYMPYVFNPFALPAIITRLKPGKSFTQKTGDLVDDLSVLTHVAPSLASNNDQSGVFSRLLKALIHVCTSNIIESIDAAQIIVKCANAGAVSGAESVTSWCTAAADDVIAALQEDCVDSPHSANVVAYLLTIASKNTTALAMEALLPTVHNVLASPTTFAEVAASSLRIYTSLMITYYAPSSTAVLSQSSAASTRSTTKRKRGKRSDKSNSSMFAAAETELEELLELLYSCLQHHGRRVGVIEVEKRHDCELLREASAVCLLQLLKLKDVNRNTSVDQWLMLSWCMLDESCTIKSSAVAALISLVQSHYVSSRFCIMPLLLANDETACTSNGIPLQKMAQQSIYVTTKRLWSTHKAMLKRFVSATDSGTVPPEECERLKHFAEDTLPECLFPYAVYLLSHHPDAPASENLSVAGDHERMKRIHKCIALYIDTLLAVVDDACESLSFMLKQSELILGYYCDRRRPDNFMLSHVVKAAMHLLRARITSPLQPSQLTVPLPTDLYLRREAPIIFDDSELGAVLSPLKSTRAKTVAAISKKLKKPVEVKTAATKKKAVKAKSSAPAIAPTRSSSRRSSVGGKEVSYRDVSEREDDALMMEIEEALEQQQLQSQNSKRSRISRDTPTYDRNDEFVNSSVSTNSVVRRPSSLSRSSVSSVSPTLPDDEWLTNGIEAHSTPSTGRKRKASYAADQQSLENVTELEKENDSELISPTKLLHRVRKSTSETQKHQSGDKVPSIKNAGKSKKNLLRLRIQKVEKLLF